MSSPTSSSKHGGPYRKPRADIYTILLIIAMVALVIGILFLSLEMAQYDWEFKGGPRVTWLQQAHAFASANVPRILRVG